LIVRAGTISPKAESTVLLRKARWIGGVVVRESVVLID